MLDLLAIRGLLSSLGLLGILGILRLLGFIGIGAFGKRIYHAKNVPSLLSTTILAGNGIYHASNDL